VIFFIALLIGYPWHILSVGAALYLLSLPLGWKSYRDHARKYAAAAAAAAVPEAGAAPANSAPPFVPPIAGAASDDRPERLH
jgi:CDP-diacylglycerol--serine O-phosphatidyltransferase